MRSGGTSDRYVWYSHVCPVCHADIGSLVGTDFCLEWRVNRIEFRCIASRLPHNTATGNDIRNITYIIISLGHLWDPINLGKRVKTANINWDTFLHTVRQFPHLRQIAIQCTGYMVSSPRQMLVEFLAHLGGAWITLDEILGLYYDIEEQGEFRWVQLRLDTLIDEIKQKV